MPVWFRKNIADKLLQLVAKADVIWNYASDQVDELRHT
jgi:hypothetical protein